MGKITKNNLIFIFFKYTNKFFKYINKVVFDSKNYLEKEELGKFANNVISRAEGGLYFLKQCLQLIHRGGTDAAFSRSIYILFSYNFELILKTLLIITKINCDISKKKLEQELRTMSHNFEKYFKKIPINIFKDIGIECIKEQKNKGFIEYKVATSDSNVKTIIFQDFINVRYDFLKDSFRSSNSDESARMKKEIEALLEMVKKIKEKIPNLNYYRKEAKEWLKNFQKKNPNLF